MLQSNSVTRQVTFNRTKIVKNAKNSSFLRVFLKPEAFGQTVLPDRSPLIEQKMVENY